MKTVVEQVEERYQATVKQLDELSRKHFDSMFDPDLTIEEMARRSNEALGELLDSDDAGWSSEKE